MGDHETNINLAALLRALVVRMFRDRRRVARVGMNQLVYFVEGDPTRYRSPDLYVIENLAQDGPERASWKTWEGDVPSFALEVVSTNWKKDYEEVPPDYDAMGVKELVVFDPWATSRSRRRVRWQVFRRARGKGLAPVSVEQGDRVESRVLGCFLRVVEEQGHVRLRVGTGPKGDTLMPTDEEAATALEVLVRIHAAQTEAERVARQAAEKYALDAREGRQAAEARAQEELAARQAAEARAHEELAARQVAEARAQEELAARQVIEAELTRVRAELERLRRGG